MHQRKTEYGSPNHPTTKQEIITMATTKKNDSGQFAVITITEQRVTKVGRSSKGNTFRNVFLTGNADGHDFTGNVQVYGDFAPDATTPGPVKSSAKPDPAIMAALAANPDALAIYMRQYA